MKKFLIAMVAIALIIICVFAAGCVKNKDKENEKLENVDIFHEVFEAAKDWETGEPEGYFSCWQRDPIQIWGAGKKVEYSSWDVLTGENLPYENWVGFSFDFKTDKYRVTKIEFDVIFKEDCNRYFDVYSRDADEEKSIKKEFELKAGEVQHLVFDNLTFRKTEKWGWVGIESGPIGNKTSNDFAYGAMIEWKLMNLKVYGELV